MASNVFVDDLYDATIMLTATTCRQEALEDINR